MYLTKLIKISLKIVVPLSIIHGIRNYVDCGVLTSVAVMYFGGVYAVNIGLTYLLTS